MICRFHAAAALKWKPRFACPVRTLGTVASPWRSAVCVYVCDPCPPPPPGSPSSAVRLVRPPSAGLSEHSHRLLSECLTVLESTPGLCSPRGALAVLPTVLLLTTSVLRQLATKPVSDQTVLAGRPAVAAALHALRMLVSDR